MNSYSDAVSSAPPGSQAVAPVEISLPRRMYWAIQRELWENRSNYIAPIAVGALAVAGFVIAAQHHVPNDLRRAATLDAVRQTALIQEPYDIAGGLMMLVVSALSVFYCLDTLYGERRDRSILFWKSLPVSDVITVLAKASIPLLVLPVLGWLVALVIQLMMALISSVVLVMNGMSVADWWAHLSLFRVSVLLLYHLITVHAFYWAPFFGWFMLVSAWARRAPILWATLPLLAISVVERIAFNTSFFVTMLQHRLMGDSESVMLPMPGMFPTHPMTHMTPGRYLANPGLWIGLAIMAVFLAGAVRLRRYREPI